jgi:dTDP-4-amino-4,6-dideoxygalactose transaminase
MTQLVVPPARPVFTSSDRDAITRLVDEALTSGSLTLGPVTERFENAFAARHRTDVGIAVSSGTAALEIILRSIGIEGRSVVVPANTFFATAAAVLHAGGQPRLADIDPSTFALSAASVASALDDDCAAVILVHIGGVISSEVEEIARLCAEAGVPLVEDAAHAHGATFHGRPAGSFGSAAAFSFYPTKVMTSGEGGMILTSDERLAAEARMYRDQGKAGFLGGEHVRLGYAWRMSELHAAVGEVQLARLDSFLEVRRRAGSRYATGLAGAAGITSVPLAPGTASNYYKYLAMLAPGIDRDEFKRIVREDHGVGMSGEVYSSPLHHQPVFRSIAHGPLPVTEAVCAHHVCLPVHSDITDDEVDHVINAVRQVAADLAGRALIS